MADFLHFRNHVKLTVFNVRLMFNSLIKRNETNASKVTLPLVSLLFLTLLNFQVNGQVIFQETFDEANTATVGSANGVNWAASCPTCLSGDHYEVNNGVLEGQDTNGEAEWTTNSIDVSNCSSVEISFDIQSLGTMEACGTGCTSVDWVRFQYNVDGTGWTNPTNSYFCPGPCADINVIASDDVGSITYSTGCLPINGNTIQLKISVQCWAASEFWLIDNVTVTCNGANPGTDGTIDLCNSSSPVNLFSVLGGSPDNGGTWTGPSNLTGGDQGTFDPSTMNFGTYTYTVGTAPCEASATVTVSNGNLGLSVANDSICLGETGTLTAVPTQGGGTFSWSPGGMTSSSISVSPATSTNYTVTYSLGGCTGTASADIIVHSLPIIDAGTDQSVCSETEITLTATGAQSYNWNNNVVNGVPFTPSAGNSSYVVTGTDVNGCSSTDSVNVNVLPSPTANGSPSIVSGGAPLDLTIDNLSTGGTNYQWDFGNGDTYTTATTESVNTSYLVEGSYVVTLIASNGQCQSTWTQLISVYNENPLVVTVPNVFSPNGDNINDQYAISVENGESISGVILNRWGNTIVEFDDLGFYWDGQIDGQDATQGTYFIQFEVTGVDGTVKTGHGFFQLVR